MRVVSRSIATIQNDGFGSNIPNVLIRSANHEKTAAAKAC